VSSVDIGEEREAIIVEPIEDPFRVPETPVETPTPVEAPAEVVPA
jgi:hypothetical protein